MPASRTTPELTYELLAMFIMRCVYMRVAVHVHVCVHIDGKGSLESLGKSGHVKASVLRREILEYKLLAAVLGKSRQVSAIRRRRDILEYSLLAAGLGKSRQA